MTGKIRLLALVFALGVLAASCGDDSDSAAFMGRDPGEVRPARADWSTGYFQAAVYAEILREQGYDVADESRSELGPDLFFRIDDHITPEGHRYLAERLFQIIRETEREKSK